jgi:single-stranded-DNA-specific exonuclease
MRGVAFGRGDWAEEMQAVNGPLDLCFAPTINRFRGQARVELMLKDWQPARELQSANPTPAAGSRPSK